MKPCPFCGRQPKPESKVIFYECEAKSGKACITLECECGLQLYDYTFDELDYDNRLEILTEKWNGRYESTESSPDA